MKRLFANAIYTVALFGIFTLFLMQPTKYMDVFFDGLTIWAHNILPAIFPFALLSTLYAKCTTTSKHIYRKIFGINCQKVFFTSLLCGYPVGAKAIAESDFDQKTSTAIASFCSTAGPIFVFTTVGHLALGNTCATIIVAVSQVLAALLNGLTYTRNRIFNTTTSKPTSTLDFGKTLTDCILSILAVGGLVALFFMLTEMLQDLLPQSIACHPFFYFVVGLLEMTNGIFKLCGVCDLLPATVLTSSLLSFGGLCIILQCYTFLSQKKVKFASIVKMKCTQSAYATIISFLLAKLFL